MPITKRIICPHCGKVAKETEVILKSDRKAQALGFRNIEELIIHYRAEGLSYREIHEKTGISRKTLDEHVPQNLRGFRAKTELHKQACRNNGKKLIALRMKKYFDHPTSNGKSKKEMSLDAMSKTIERKYGMYYTPKSLECKINIMIKGLDCKTRTDDVNDWCDNCKDKYLKIADPSTGSGAFLKHAADGLSNPPYGFPTQRGADGGESGEN